MSVWRLWVSSVVLSLVWGLFRGESGPSLACRLVVVPALSVALLAVWTYCRRRL